MATNKPSKIHGYAAPKKSLTILHSSFKIPISQSDFFKYTRIYEIFQFPELLLLN